MPKSTLTLGTFDGVHRGHRAILQRVVSRARRARQRSIALTFGMPPRMLRRTRTLPRLLTTPAEKKEILRRLGIQKIHWLIFDRRTASTPPEAFFGRTVVRRLRAARMIVGPRVAFGKNRAGRLPQLRRLGRQYGVRIEVVQPVRLKGLGVVASRRIRALLEIGRLEKANALLGYPYSAAGRVVHGSHRGHKLGFPTANIAVDPHKILPKGVYWVKVLPARAPFPFAAKDAARGVDGLCNVGTRPTFTPREHHLHCEVFLFGSGSPHGTLYGRSLRVIFLRKIRAEKRFSSKEALVRQIASDFRLARRWAGA